MTLEKYSGASYMNVYNQVQAKIEMGEIASLMRGLWLRRNEYIFEGSFKSPSQVIRIAKDDFNDFQLAQQKIRERQGSSSERRNQAWKKPRENYVKVNWDAAVDQKGRKIGIGVIIRDEEGEALVAVEGQQRNMDHPAVGESYALWKALEICKDLKLERVIFEGDAQSIVKAVNSQEVDKSVYRSIVEAAKKVLSLWKDWSIEFVYRNANEVAHTLAKEALHLDTEFVWIEEVPSCIRNIIEKERTCNE